MVFVNDIKVWDSNVKEVQELLSFLPTNIITLLVVANSPSVTDDKPRYLPIATLVIQLNLIRVIFIEYCILFRIIIKRGHKIAVTQIKNNFSSYNLKGTFILTLGRIVLEIESSYISNF